MEHRTDENGSPLDCASLIGREFVHFKGNRYRLLDFAKDTESQELMVVYRALYGTMEHWVRPAKMFFETVERDGYVGPRFRLVEERDAKVMAPQRDEEGVVRS